MTILGPGTQTANAGPSYVDSLGNPDCIHGGNYGSTACLLYQTAYLLETSFNQISMYVDPALVSSGNHTNQGLWATSGSPCKSTVEMDYVYGFERYAGYVWAAARLDYNYPIGQISYAEYLDDYTTNSGNVTKYQIKFTGGSGWQLWRNDIYRFGFSGGSLGAGSCIGQAGLEFSRVTQPPNAYFSSATAYHTIYWYDTTMAFRGGWGSANSWIDYPCNLGQVPPNCLNGTFNTGSQWGANKP